MVEPFRTWGPPRCISRTWTATWVCACSRRRPRAVPTMAGADGWWIWLGRRALMWMIWWVKWWWSYYLSFCGFKCRPDETSNHRCGCNLKIWGLDSSALATALVATKADSWTTWMTSNHSPVTRKTYAQYVTCLFFFPMLRRSKLKLL